MVRLKYKNIPGQFSIFEIIQLDSISTNNERRGSSFDVKKLYKSFEKMGVKAGSDKKKRIKRDKNAKYEIYVPVFGVPKKIKEMTQVYANKPYLLSPLDAFRKAAGEYKNPSKKLRMALEKDNFKMFIPSEYEDKNKKYVKRCLNDYEFPRYVGQKVRLGDIRGKEYTISSFNSYYTFFEGCHGPYDNDDTLPKIFGTPYGKTRIVPADMAEYIESLKVELEYNEYGLERATEKGVINAAKANISSLKKAIEALTKELEEKRKGEIRK